MYPLTHGFKWKLLSSRSHSFLVYIMSNRVGASQCALTMSAVRELIFDYGGIDVMLTWISLSKTCDADLDMVDFVLKQPIKVDQVCALTGYSEVDHDVAQKRFERLLDAAKDDLPLMDSDTFKKVIVLQLALTCLRKSKVWPHEVTDEEVCQLLLRSISGRLVTEHVVSVRVINYLREQRLVAKVNVGDTIPHLCMAWRRSLYDVLCIHSFMEILAIPLPLLRVIF